MSIKSIKLSSEGLKNIVPNACQEDSHFSFVFGEKEIKMNTIFAQFISPAASRILRSDPTINYIRYDADGETFSNIHFKENLTQDVISLLMQISSGYSIDVDVEQSIKLRMIAILLDNEELFKKLNELFPNDLNEDSIDLYLQDLQFCNSQYKHQFQSCSFNCFNDTHIIEYIASHFYSIDENKLLQLPRSILYSIITNKHLKLRNEDSLFNFIQKIFAKDNFEYDYDYDEEEDDRFDDSDDTDKINILSFYETIDFSSLSEKVFQEFVENFKSSKMTKTLWRKLYPCFYTNYSKINKKKYSDRYLSEDRLFEYDGDINHRFDGIISHLSEEAGGNVNDKGKVKVTSSPINGEDFLAKYAVDFDDEHYFQTKNEPNSWLKYDFNDSQVRPTHYSIKTRPDGGKGDNHPKNWVIEGSNTDNGQDWKILDSRNDVTLLDDGNKSYTFEIQNPLKKNESYRYLRLRQTGPNTQSGNYYYLTISALEYFGVLCSK